MQINWLHSEYSESEHMKLEIKSIVTTVPGVFLKDVSVFVASRFKIHNEHPLGYLVKWNRDVYCMALNIECDDAIATVCTRPAFSSHYDEWKATNHRLSSLTTPRLFLLDGRTSNQGFVTGGEEQIQQIFGEFPKFWRMFSLKDHV